MSTVGSLNDMVSTVGSSASASNGFKATAINPALNRRGKAPEGLVFALLTRKCSEAREEILLMIASRCPPI